MQEEKPKKMTINERNLYAEQCVELIKKQPRILHVVVVSTETGDPISSTMDSATSLSYAGLFDELIEKASIAVPQLLKETDTQAEDESVQLTQIRLNTMHHEVFITLEPQLIFIALQLAPDPIFHLKLLHPEDKGDECD